jgi:hypothetical protein
MVAMVRVVTVVGDVMVLVGATANFVERMVISVVEYVCYLLGLVDFFLRVITPSGFCEECCFKEDRYGAGWYVLQPIQQKTQPAWLEKNMCAKVYETR